MDNKTEEVAMDILDRFKDDFNVSELNVFISFFVF